MLGAHGAERAHWIIIYKDSRCCQFHLHIIRHPSIHLSKPGSDQQPTANSHTLNILLFHSHSASIMSAATTRFTASLIAALVTLVVASPTALTQKQIMTKNSVSTTAGQPSAAGNWHVGCIENKNCSNIQAAAHLTDISTSPHMAFCGGCLKNPEKCTVWRLEFPILIDPPHLTNLIPVGVPVILPRLHPLLVPTRRRLHLMRRCQAGSQRTPCQ